MKLLSYRHGDKESWGAFAGDTVIDLAAAFEGRFPTLRSALAANLLPQLAGAVERAPAGIPLADVSLLPVVPDPSKILCIGVNYHDHRIETGRDPSAKPVVFPRFANSQVGQGGKLVRPPESEQFDYEGEIAIVIGKRGRRVAAADAWEYVAGYAPYCDGTLRDWQHHTHQWAPGKNFPATGAFGPWMVTADEIESGADLSLVTRLNGTELQRSSTRHLIFDIPSLLAYCSTFTALEPGDVIVTGTPGGVGGKRTPPIWMKHGDVLEVEVGRVGTLRMEVADEPAN